MSESQSWCSSWKNAPPTRTIPLQMFQCFNTTNQSFAVGSVFFFPHLKVETKQVNNHDRSLATPIPETTILPNDNEYTENDNEMTDSSKGIIEEQVAADTCLWIALPSTPFAYQIKQKRITDLKEGTKQTLYQKFEKSQQKLEQKFAEYALNAKVIVLVTFKLKTLVFLLHQSKNKRKIKKFERFLECLFSIGILQDAAYGVNKIKFGSGEKQKVSNIILTMKYSPTISYYKQVCYESLFSSLSDSSLWRMLHGIKPSYRKSLMGLDDSSWNERFFYLV